MGGGEVCRCVCKLDFESRESHSREVAVDREGSIDIDIFCLGPLEGRGRLELVRHVRPGWHAGLTGQPTIQVGRYSGTLRSIGKYIIG